MADTPTIEDLTKQRAALDMAFANVEAPLIAEGLAIMADPALSTATDKVKDLIGRMPEGVSRQQLTNVLIVLSNVPVALNAERDRVGALISAAA